MQRTIPILAVNQFILDCTEVIMDLDAITTRHHHADILGAFEVGRTEYEKLLKRRISLTMTAPETRLTLSLLDGITARLRFLENTGLRTGSAE